MPRIARSTIGGICYHVLNRGNARGVVFHAAQDYEVFLEIMARAHSRLPMRVLAYCLMPNHFHMVLWPQADCDLGRWMQWLLTSHVRWHHKRHGGSGHLWQGRFKAFAVQDDANLHAVLRYVERNPLRAGLVTRSEEWPWSSLTKWNLPHKPTFLCESPLARVEPWVDYVNLPQTNEELELLRASVERGIPFGEREWVRQTAARLGLAYAI